MTYLSPLYPHWLKVRDVLQSSMPPEIRSQLPATTRCSDLATTIVEALRPQLTNDTVELEKRLHVGAAEAGWDMMLLAFARTLLDSKWGTYRCAIVTLDKPQSRDGWTLSHALLVNLPTGQVSWRLTAAQAEAMNAIGVPTGGASGGWVFDGHTREVKYERLRKYAAGEWCPECGGAERCHCRRDE